MLWFVLFVLLCQQTLLSISQNPLESMSKNATLEVSNKMGETVKAPGQTVQQGAESVKNFKVSVNISAFAPDVDMTPRSGMFGPCPFSIARFDDLFWRFLVLNYFNQTSKEMLKYCRRYQTYYQNLTNFITNVNCIHGAQVILRSAIKVAIMQQFSLSQELCSGPVKNFGNWEPFLKKIVKMTTNHINEAILYTQDLADDTSMYWPTALSRYVCMMSDFTNQIDNIIEGIASDEAKDFAKRYALKVFSSVSRYFRFTVGPACEEVNYPAVEINKIRSKSLVLPTLALFGVNTTEKAKSKNTKKQNKQTN